MKRDIRWMQRYRNFNRAVDLLQEAAKLKNPSDLEIEGMIQRFEYSFELAWKTLKDYLEEKGFAPIVGSKEALRLAFANGIITDGETWMKMIQSRNLTSNLYDQNVANSIAELIRASYLPCFLQLKQCLMPEADG